MAPLRSELSLDFVIANGENPAGGYGITLDIVQELQDCRADVISSGNHIWDQKAVIPYMDSGIRLMRPANYADAPGSGCFVTDDLLVVNLMSRVFMPALDCPFRTVDRILEQMTIDHSYKAMAVDFHTEATSEKQGMGWYLDRRVEWSCWYSYPCWPSGCAGFD
ncbi:MAG: YmdB family metallophosphoesterase [Chloroflexota bacterium]|nr:YmdB family metallophosphoesterase [Chloroflexota bacterium]